MRNKATYWLLFLLLCPGLCVLPSAAYGQDSLVLGVHPFQSLDILEEQFSPLVDYLSTETGFEVQLRVGTSYQEHIDALGHDRIDLAYIGPVGYVQMVDRYGQKPLIAVQEVNGQPFFQGVILARVDSGFDSLADLNEGDFAFVDRHSTMGFFLPASILLQHNPAIIEEKRYQFLRTHENVALGVLAGDFVAGAVKENVFQAYKQSGLKILTKTPPVTEHLFVASSKLSSQTLATLRNLILELHTSSRGQAAMRSIKPSISRFVPANDAAYDSLRTIMSELERKGLLQ